jgi:hypothetical protein
MLILQLSKKGLSMTNVKSKRGLTRYDHNPFINQTMDATKRGIRRITNKNGDKMMVVSENTGEIVATAGFWQTQEVDKTQFVKLYVNGVKAFRDLTSAGTKVFEVLYLKVQEAVGQDFLYISLAGIDQAITPMSKATFMRGMSELVAKGFIAESLEMNKYYLNPDYMWNGDRLSFVQQYRKISTKPKYEIDNQTLDLFEHYNNVQQLEHSSSNGENSNETYQKF